MQQLLAPFAFATKRWLLARPALHYVLSEEPSSVSLFFLCARAPPHLGKLGGTFLRPPLFFALARPHPGKLIPPILWPSRPWPRGQFSGHAPLVPGGEGEVGGTKELRRDRLESQWPPCVTQPFRVALRPLLLSGQSATLHYLDPMGGDEKTTHGTLSHQKEHTFSTRTPRRVPGALDPPVDANHVFLWEWQPCNSQT